MGFFDEIKSALPEVFDAFGQAVIWNDTEYKCTVTQGQSSAELEAGGFVDECDFNIKFLESQLGTIRPKIGDIVQYNSVNYRIEWVSSFVNRGQLEVSAKAKNEG